MVGGGLKCVWVGRSGEVNWEWERRERRGECVWGFKYGRVGRVTSGNDSAEGISGLIWVQWSGGCEMKAGGGVLLMVRDWASAMRLVWPRRRWWNIVALL